MSAEKDVILAAVWCALNGENRSLAWRLVSTDPKVNQLGLEMWRERLTKRVDPVTGE